jgi:hypothetical protein
MLPFIELFGARIPVYGVLSGIGILVMFLILDR